MRRQLLAWGLPILILAGGCESGSSTGPAAIEFEPPPAPSGVGFVAQYAPPVDVGPYPNDIYNLPGQTLSVPVKITSPLAPALNTLDGFSTTAKISAPFNDTIDPATLVPFNPLAPPTGAESIFVLNASTGTPLVPGLHYSVQVSSALGTNGTLLEFEPLVPLAPDSTYVFLLTASIKSAAGVAASADTVFRLVRDAHLAGVMTGNPGLDSLLPAVGPLVDLGVNVLGLPGTVIVSAWSVSTQSTSDVFEWLDANASAQASLIVPTGMSTAALGRGLPGIADIYVGFLEIPYFGNPAEPLSSFWLNSSFLPLTRDNPVPIPQGGQLRIPVLATLPNAASNQTKPAAGWPVVIIQHGVIANRLVTLAVADAFAQAGFATIAIDLPLHGITDITNPFYQGPSSPFGNNERHFNLDNVGDVGDLAPDGQIDNGWQIFNIANPLNARDHARQAVSDLMNLARTIPTMDFDGDLVPDLDGARKHLVSHSLGGMFVMAYLAVSNDVNTVTMTSPAGPFMDFLYEPEAINFGLPVRQGIEAEGLAFGTVGFDNFVRDLQTVLDPIDAANYAAATAAKYPIHVIEVLGDQSVPPSLSDGIAALMGLDDISTTTVDPAGIRGIVRFTAGAHSSLFDPSADLGVTIEMQTETVTFAASGGSTLPINNPELVQ